MTATRFPPPYSCTKRMRERCGSNAANSAYLICTPRSFLSAAMAAISGAGALAFLAALSSPLRAAWRRSSACSRSACRRQRRRLDVEAQRPAGGVLAHLLDEPGRLVCRRAVDELEAVQGRGRGRLEPERRCGGKCAFTELERRGCAERVREKMSMSSSRGPLARLLSLAFARAARQARRARGFALPGPPQSARRPRRPVVFPLNCLIRFTIFGDGWPGLARRKAVASAGAEHFAGAWRRAGDTLRRRTRRLVTR